MHFQDWVKAVVIRKSKCQPSFWFCSTLKYYRLYIKIIMGNCTPSYELLIQWYSLHHYSFLGSRVVATGMSTSESWCVKSIFLATSLLDSYWTLLSFLMCWFLNHHSKIDCATLSIFLVHISIDELGFCQVLTHLIISSCPEKQDCSRA